MKIVVTLIIGLMLMVQTAGADERSRFIGERLTEQYNSNIRKAGSDSAKKSKLTAIYKDAISKINKSSGMAAQPIAYKAAAEMKSVF